MSDPSLHFFPHIQKFFDLATGGKMDVQFLGRPVRCNGVLIFKINMA